MRIENKEIIRKIRELKKRKGAIILAHNYQQPEVQQIADFLGDSLELSRKAAQIDAKIIVFCGVYFMAETAKILSPQKKVLIPREDARCPMADMITVDDIIEMKREHPKALVCSYINTNADVKAVSDFCCTSANPTKVVERMPSDEIIFVPDRNLAWWVARHTRKKIIPFDGYCYVHRSFRPNEVKMAKEARPSAVLIVHPECDPEVLQIADAVRSTSGMLKFARETNKTEFLIATEEGLIERMRREMPKKRFFTAGRPLMCQNMKKIGLEEVLESLEEEIYEIEVPKDIMKKAELAIKRMVKIRG